MFKLILFIPWEQLTFEVFWKRIYTTKDSIWEPLIRSQKFQGLRDKELILHV